MTLGKGNLLYNRYRVVEILGRGGMGAVYRATDESLGVDVAVKENLFTTDDYARQFRMEAVILAGIRHPNLPRVSDHFVIDDMGQYLVMDYIEGDDLRQVLEKNGPISETEAIRIGAAACDALTYLHTRKPPIFHRDIKLGNLKIAPDGHVFLVDFGLAKMGWEHEETMTGARAMTPGYSPPEQYGSARTDARSDIYSLGATLYAALTGVIPEDSLTRAVDGISLTPLRKHRSDVSTRLATVIEKALETSAVNRFQTAEAFKSALIGHPISELVTQAPPSTLMSKTNPVTIPVDEIKRRSFTLLALTGLFLIVLIVGGGILFFNPSLLARFKPAASPTLTIAPTFVATAKPTETTAQQVIVVASATPAATITPVLTATATSTLQPTTTSTETPEPTASLTALAPAPTAIGGNPGQLAFASVTNNAAQIFLENADGSDLHALTNIPKGACSFDWSPDGNQIVFASPCADKLNQYPDSSLYLLDVTTGQVSPLPYKARADFEPSWSPDGKTIAFTSARDGSMQIYVYKLADASLVRITTPDTNAPQSRYPTWSPDSSQIIFTVLRLGLQQIWIMSADGSNKKQLVNSGNTSADYAPAWSGDGTFILYSETNHELTAPSSLWQYTFSTNAITHLPFTQPVVDVSISPDGKWIAFKTSDGVNQDVYIASLPNGTPVRLSTSAGVDFDPVWRKGK